MSRYISMLMLAACLVFHGAEPTPAGEETQTVTVTGLGANEDAANRQAYRNAVQQAVGTMVIAETIVENDELIRDKIVAHSDGYVTEVKQIGAARPAGDGLVEVTVLATVKMGELRAKLKAENIKVAEMDGQSLFAELATKQEKEASLKDVAKAALQDGCVSVVKAEAGKPRNGEKPGQIVVPVTISVDDRAYAAFCRNLEKTLEAAGLKPIEKSVDLRISESRHHALGKSADFYRVDEGLGNDSKPDEIDVVCIVKKLLPEAKSARVKIYRASREALEGLVESVKWLSVKVEIRDEEDEAIASETISVDMTEKGRKRIASPGTNPDQFDWAFFPVMGSFRGDGDHPYMIFTITPRLDARFTPSYIWGLLEVGSSEGGTMVRDVAFTLDSEEIKQARSIQCTVFEDIE